MFLDNLSASIRSLCNARKLGYEAASEQCDLSSRYFGSIARGKTAPSVLTLEKLCVGFDLTPNELLLAPELQHEMMLCEMEPASRVFCETALMRMRALRRICRPGYRYGRKVRNRFELCRRLTGRRRARRRIQPVGKAVVPIKRFQRCARPAGHALSAGE